MFFSLFDYYGTKENVCTPVNCAFHLASNDFASSTMTYQYLLLEVWVFRELTFNLRKVFALNTICRSLSRRAYLSLADTAFIIIQFLPKHKNCVTVFCRNVKVDFSIYCQRLRLNPFTVFWSVFLAPSKRVLCKFIPAHSSVYTNISYMAIARLIPAAWCIKYPSVLAPKYRITWVKTRFRLKIRWNIVWCKHIHKTRSKILYAVLSAIFR